MRVAVVGAGLFGSTAAIYAARAGHDVHLFERNGDILLETSGINHQRLHEGYHYPRSPETGQECRAGLSSFIAEYDEAIIRGGTQIYAIAKQGSKVTASEYLNFCYMEDLPFRPEGSFLDLDAIEMGLRVREAHLSIARLKVIVREKLSAASVHVHLNTMAEWSLRNSFDRIILATYGNINRMCEELDCETQNFEFAIVEKLIVKLPDEMKYVDIMVMDGPFCNISPIGRSGYHMLGHVTESDHCGNAGLYPKIPDHLKEFVNSALCFSPKHTRKAEILKASAQYIEPLRRAEYVASAFTVRATLVGQQETDARPTLVHEIDDQVIRLFSGKLATSVAAAQNTCAIFEEEREEFSQPLFQKSILPLRPSPLTIPHKTDERVRSVA